jgi:hypothetical protein
MNELINFAQVPAVAAIKAELAKYYSKKSVLLENLKNKPNDLVRFKSLVHDVELQEVSSFQEAFALLKTRVSRAKDAASLQKACNALNELSNFIKVEKTLTNLFGTKAPKKTLAFKITKILGEHNLEVEFFKASIYQALEIYKKARRVSDVVVDTLQARLVEESEANAVRQHIINTINFMVHDVSSQDALIDLINNCYRAHLRSTARLVIGYADPTEVVAANRIMKRENSARIKSRKVAEKNHKIIKLHAELDHVADELDTLIPAFEEEAVAKAVQEIKHREDMSQAFNQFHQDYDEFMDAPEGKALALMIDIEAAENNISAEEDRMVGNIKYMDRAKKTILKELDTRRGIENNYLSAVGIDVTRVKKYQHNVDKAAKIFWNYIPLVNLIPAISSAYEARKAKIQNYVDYENNALCIKVMLNYFAIKGADIDNTVGARAKLLVAMENEKSRLEAMAHQYDSVDKGHLLSGVTNNSEDLKRFLSAFDAHAAAKTVKNEEMLKLAQLRYDRFSLEKGKAADDNWARLSPKMVHQRG